MCFNLKVTVSKGFSALLPLVLLGCSSLPLSSGTASAQGNGNNSGQSRGNSSGTAGVRQSSDEQSQLMYEVMVAELAGRRGQLDQALAGYMRASELTDDTRVLDRTTRLLLISRQWADAEALASRWMDLDPASKDAPNLLAQSLLKQNKPKLAAEIYIDELEKTDDRSLALKDIQFELQRNNDPGASVIVMQDLADAYPQQSEASLGLARAQISTNDTASALVSIEQALVLAPEDTDALMLRAQILSASGKSDEALESLSDALLADEQNTSLRLGYAQMLVEAGRYDQISDQLAQIHSESANDPDTFLSIGLLAIESRRLDQAREYLTDLLDSGAYSDQANFYLARINDEQKKYEQAIANYDAVGEGDLSFTARLRAAELTAFSGELDSGRQRLEALADLTVDPALQPRLITAEARMLQNADQLDEAVKVLSEGLQQFPDQRDLLYARALMAGDAGDPSQLIGDLEKLIELDPDDAHALNALGYHLTVNNGDLDRAEQLLVQARQLLPDDPAIMDSMGWLWFKKGEYDKAVEVLNEAYTRYPDAEVAAHLAQALWFSGARDEARELVEQALQVDPDDENLLAVVNDTFK